MELTIQEIQKILPHRYPFLLVDKIIESDDEHIVGIKNVTFNEPFFQGHFPGIPIMPGVLIIEAMAQVSGVLFLSIPKDNKKRITYFAGIDKAKFRKPVRPGDQLRFDITVSRIRKNSLKTHGTATVDGEVVAEADLFMMTETIEKE
jgi:beta-hydroxyacyl-ACP dehydratase FabZ